MKYLVKYIFLFLVVSLAVFLIVRAIPISPEEMLLQRYNLPINEENKAVMREMYGLNKGLIEQYFLWLKDFIRGDFGYSFVTKVPVKTEIIRRLPYSIAMGLISLLLSMLISFFLGYISAIKSGGIVDNLTRFISIFSLSVPSFILAIYIIYFVGVRYKIIKFFSGNIFSGMTTAIIILIIYQIGSLSRVVKKSFEDVSKKTFVKFYLLRGFKIEYVLLRHCYKPVLYSLLSVSISKFSSVVGGSSVLEFLFAIPGVSYFLVSSIVARDYNFIQAYIFFIFIWMSVIHIIFDFLLNILKEKGVE